MEAGKERADMAVDKELEIEGGKLGYRVCGEEAAVLSCQVQGSRVRIPDEADGFPLTKLDKKVFLSCKMLKEIWLPKGLREIGDWAFAYCSSLESIWLPRGEISFGRGIFKECGNLASIRLLGEKDDAGAQIGKLLGSVPIKLEADYLLTPDKAGEAEWLRRYDDKLREFLMQPDEDGYTKMVYCGEEDIVANMDNYLAERRRAKSRLCFLRLINNIGLEEEFGRELRNYLAGHTKGCDSEAAWEVVFEEHGGEQDYYAAFTDAGCLTGENYDAILSQMGESFPEMKGYLMRYKSQQMEETDFFDSLSL